MDEPLFLNDPYAKEFDSEVVDIFGGKNVVLRETVFYPQGGGQPGDTGFLATADGQKFTVTNTWKFEGKVLHELEKPGLAVGQKVHGDIDWERRYLLMRNHTAAHILSGVIHKLHGAMITGNQLGTDKTRIDFSLVDFSKEQMENFIAEANAVVDAGHEVKAYYLTKEEAANVEEISKLAKGLPPDITNIRVVDIVGFDKQPDGGTHVKNTKEVGHLVLLKCENKGASNRRAYFKVE